MISVLNFGIHKRRRTSRLTKGLLVLGKKIAQMNFILHRLVASSCEEGSGYLGSRNMRIFLSGFATIRFPSRLQGEVTGHLYSRSESIGDSVQASRST